MTQTSPFRDLLNSASIPGSQAETNPELRTATGGGRAELEKPPKKAGIPANTDVGVLCLAKYA